MQPETGNARWSLKEGTGHVTTLSLVAGRVRGVIMKRVKRNTNFVGAKLNWS